MLIVVGDYNLHDINWNHNDDETYYLAQNILSHTRSEYFQAASEFLQNMLGLPMFQVSNIKNIASNVLDLVFVNDHQDVQVCQAPISITKLKGIVRFHPALEISFEYHPVGKPSSSNETVEVFLYNRGNYERMSKESMR